MGDPGSTDNPRTAPPTAPGAPSVMAPEAQRWPTVIGVLAIVFALLEVASSALGTVLLPLIASATHQQNQVTAVGWFITSASILAMLAHLAGGVQTMRRVRIGPRILRWWACLDIALTVITSIWSANVALSGQGPTVPNAPFTPRVAVTMMLAGMATKLIWPVFLLIFLSRPARKAHWKSWR